MIAGVGALVVLGLGAGLAVTYAAPHPFDRLDPLDPPTRVSATPLSPTSVEVDWSGSKNADSYVVKVATDRALTMATNTTVPATGTKIKLANIAATTPGIDRYFRVDAVRDGKVRSSRTGRFTLMPGVIAKLHVTQTTADGFRASWRKVANARQFDVTVARDKRFKKGSHTVRTKAGSHTFASRGLAAATTYWLRIRPINSEQVGAYSAPVTFRTAVRESSFKVGTWNVCSEKCSGYPGRARIMAAFLNANKLDMFGLQESGGQRVGRTTNAIFSGGTQRFVRANGGAEARYIFYRPALFTQLSGGFFPIGDGRHTTWGKFKVKKTGRIFYFVDVHLENGHGSDAKRAREMGAMLGRMAAINDTGRPMIYAGDFNSGIHRPSDSPGAKMRAAGFSDTVGLVKAPINADINSGHTFATTVLRSGDYVDHIWVSKDFATLAWQQLVRITGGGYTRPVVSDHNALSAVLALDAVQRSVGQVTPTTRVAGLTSSLR